MLNLCKDDNLRLTYISLAHKGSTTVRPRFSRNFQDCKIVAWNDTQAPNVLPKFICTILKIAFNFEPKYFNTISKLGFETCEVENSLDHISEPLFAVYNSQADLYEFYNRPRGNLVQISTSTARVYLIILFFTFQRQRIMSR